jgi:hypothetical protein
MKPVVTDPYCYPGTRVLINLRDLQDRDELDTFESDMVTTRLAQFKRNPITGPFNLKRLQETHRRIFQDVYPWAGSIRQYTGTMSKTRANGTTVTYCDSNFIMNVIAPVFAALEQENFLRGLAVPQSQHAPRISTENSTQSTRSAKATAVPCGNSLQTSHAKPDTNSTGAPPQTLQGKLNKYFSRAMPPSCVAIHR